MRSIHVVVLTLLIHTYIADTHHNDNFMIVQISPIIDNKAAKPTNFTIPHNNTSPLSHTLSVSSTNFHKNVSIGLQLFAWYNGGWISKKTRTLQITQRRRIYSPSQRYLMNFMKYADLNNINSRQPVVLNHTAIYISYDVQGSLMTSQIQQPHLFIPNSNYMPVKDINKSIQRINTTLQFRIVHKTDQFIDNKRALSDLAQIQLKSSDIFPIIAVPLNKEVVQPSQIMEIVRKNMLALAGQQKKVGEKLQLISRYGYKQLLTRDIYKLEALRDYLPIDEYLAKLKLTLKDSYGPIWQWIYNQPFILSQINTLHSAFLHQSDNLMHLNILKQLSQAAKLKQNIQWGVFLVWIVLDILCYWCYSHNLGLSSSNGCFLNILIISQVVGVSVRVALASIWYLGLLVFFIVIFLHQLFSYLIQRRVNKYQHARSNSDTVLTSLIKNTLILLVVVNILMHLFGKTTITLNKIWIQGMQVLNRLQANPILSILWSFSQFSSLLTQYYYVLILIPQIVLNFRLKNVQNTTLLRILLIVAICYSEYGLSSLSSQPIQLAFCFKQGILAAILLLQWLFYRKNTVQPLQVQTYKGLQHIKQQQQAWQLQNKQR